jgi:predicted lipid-binding transport protein (Tim44 family)/ribosomal 50S subunit-recycling heat shock protein
MVRNRGLFVIFCFLLLFSVAAARGGGGCFLPETLIKTASGEKPISKIAVGEQIVSFEGSNPTDAKVIAVYQVEAAAYLEVKTKNAAAKLTGEQLVSIGEGAFKEAKNLSPNDSIAVYYNGALRSEKIESIALRQQNTKVFNLLVDRENTYIANSILAHNKGCFLPDTKILLADGSTKQISEIKIGDKLKAFDYDGSVLETTVNEIYSINAEEYFLLRTENFETKATAEHPFYIGNGIFKTAEQLQPGEEIFVFDGKQLAKEKIVSKELVKENITAYNLLTDWPNTYFANFAAVHNKGGGCFAAGTKVMTAGGEKNIEEIKKGDTVTAVGADGAIKNATVLAIFKTTDRIVRIKTANNSVDTTAEHPFLLPNGEFKNAAELSIGDSIITFDGWHIREEKIAAKELLGEEAVFNLQVEQPYTFIANGFVVHNKGGSSGGSHSGSSDPNTSGLVCGQQKSLQTKDAGTLNGSECIYVYYAKTSVTESNNLSTCVSGTADVWNNCMQLTTFAISSEQRFQCANQQECDKLPDYIELQSGQKIKVVKSPTILELFLGFFPILFAIIFVLVWIAIVKTGISRGLKLSENLDYCYSAAQIGKKTEKTAKVLGYLKGLDKMWQPELMLKTARETFLLLQQCWEAREYSAMQPLLLPDLYAQHLSQLESMKRNHEINKLGDLQVNKIEIVHLRHAAKKEQQEFTALIEATVKDYYVNDTTGAFLRGDSAPETFQEFWVFQRSGDRWLLREIEQTRESNALREENFVEELTPMQLGNMYGALGAKAEGEKAPWLEKSVAEKGNKVQRLLNFLSTLDKSWDEDSMKEKARQIFVQVFTAMERQDMASAEPFMLLEAIAKYSEKINEMKNDKRSVEYRNLCVRKVDIVLVKNRNDNNKDEFTACISAHAQKIETKNGEVTHMEEYVSPFEEYWTFRKQNGEWKLLETQEPFNAKTILEMENVDEESSKEQLQWYYSQERAV